MFDWIYIEEASCSIPTKQFCELAQALATLPAHGPHSMHCYLQEYASNLGDLVNIVVSHHGLPLKSVLVSQLFAALVLPAPDRYRSLLRRFAALGTDLAVMLKIKKQMQIK